MRRGTAEPSGRGMFVHLPALPGTGEFVLVEFELGPDGSIIRARAELSWIMPVLVESTQAVGVGLRFVEMDAEDRQQIRSITKRLHAAGQQGP